MIVSQSVTGALTRLQGQILLNGLVEAIGADGMLFVGIQGTILQARAVVDHVFRAGAPVLLARADTGAWVVLGPGATSGGASRGGLMPAQGPLPSSALASQSLDAAVARLIDAQNRVLRGGTITAVLADGALAVRLQVGEVLARAATTQRFAPGLTVYAIQTDAGTYLVLGSTGR